MADYSYIPGYQKWRGGSTDRPFYPYNPNVEATYGPGAYRNSSVWGSSDLPDDYFEYRFEANNSPSGQFRRKAQSLMDDPKALWNTATTKGDELAAMALGVSPSASVGRGTQAMQAVKSTGTLKGLAGLSNVAGAGLSAFGAYGDARNNGEDFDDSLISAGAAGLGSWGGAAAGAGIGTLFGGPVGGLIGAVLGGMGGSGLANAGASYLWDMTPFGQKQLSPEDQLKKEEQEAWVQQLGRARELSDLQFEVGKESALFEEEIAKRAAQDRYEKAMAMQMLADMNLQQRQLLSDTIGSYDNQVNSNRQFLAALYG